MSAILIRLFADGIVFGADRNVTVNGVCDGSVTTDKVCKSANGNVLIGSIGEGELGGKWALEQITEVVDAYADAPLAIIAKEVQSAVYHQRKDDDKGKSSPGEQIVNLAGFEERDGVIVPECYYISNCYELTEKGTYDDVRQEFGCSPEVKIQSDQWELPAKDLRERLRALQNGPRPFGFQHSINLAKFNVLDQYARSTVDSLLKIDPALLPVSLEDWAKQIGLSLRLFGAYYQTYEPDDKQFVGGGADVVYVPWP